MRDNVFVTIPTTEAKDYCLEEFAEALNGISHNLTILIHDDSQDPRHVDKIQKLIPTAVVHHRPRPEGEPVLHWLMRVRNRLRDGFIKSKCRHNLMLDSDVIINQEMFDKMLALSKEGNHWVGPWMIYGYGVEGEVKDESRVRQMVLKSGNIALVDEKDRRRLDDYNKKELAEMPEVFDCHAVSLACSMMSKKIMVDVPFESHPLIAMGEDIWWFNNAEARGYHATCINEEIKHLTHNWDEIASKEKYTSPKMEFILRSGDKLWDEVNVKELRKKTVKKGSRKSKSSKKNSKGTGDQT